MQEIHVDSEEVHKLAARVRLFCEAVGSLIEHLDRGVEEAGESWQDKHFHAFNEAYETATAALRRQLDEMHDEMAGRLDRLADIIDEAENV